MGDETTTQAPPAPAARRPQEPLGPFAGGGQASAGAPPASTGRSRRPLGQQLLERGLLRPEQLEVALKEQRRTHEFLGKILGQLGFVEEQTLLEIIAHNVGVPFESIQGRPLDTALIASFPEALLREHLFVPLERGPEAVTVGMANPADVVASDLVRTRMGLRVHVVAVTETEILEAIRGSFKATELPEDPAPPLPAKARAKGNTDADAAGDGFASSVSDIVDHVLAYAVKNRATDIHIEPEEKLLRIRYRVDGVLHPGENLPARMIPQVITRIKILSNLDISEKRLPQDGRFRFTFGKNEIDLRVSLMPTAFGENIVMRILDKSTVSLSLDHLGLPSWMRERLESIANLPYGVCFVTGPTGSGKTTTLYSMLRSINALEKKVVTVEDPIEYQLPLVRQSQMKASIGFTFAAALRSILRQDPDVILVGEIRDLETADVTVKAALTGHLVLTSLHTNSAAGAFPRLVDIGIDPYLVNSCVVAAQAQRLVRRVCADCKEEVEPTADHRAWLGGEVDRLWRGRGCVKCNQTGYRGRTGVYELLVVDDAIRKVIAEQGSENFVAQAHRERGGRFLLDDAKEKAREGVTTVEEAMRLSREVSSGI